MKKYLILALLFAFCLTGIVSAKSQPNFGPGHNNKGPGGPRGPKLQQGSLPAQKQARTVLMRTAKYLEQAQQVSKRSRHMRQNRQGLGQAITHQKRAREYYQDGWFERAIAHSVRARKIAVDIIQKNRGRVPDQRPFDDYDDRFVRIYADKDLDVEIQASIVDDDAALEIFIDLD